MREVDCDFCGSGDAELFAERPRRPDTLHTRFVRCRRCRLVFANPRADADDARRHYESVEDRGSSALGATGEAWDAAVASRRRHLEQAARHLRSESDDPSFLEIGFGDASALVAARELGWRPYGVEYAGWLVDDAKSRRGLANVLVSDVAEAPFEPGTFDVVYAWHVIEHVLDVQQWLDRIAQLLRPGGVAMIATENAASFFGRAWRAAFRVAQRTPYPPTSTDHTYWFEASHLEGFATRAMLDPVETRVYENTPVELIRGVRAGTFRNPRWAATFGLYITSAAVAQVNPSQGGKLTLIARR